MWHCWIAQNPLLVSFCLLLTIIPVAHGFRPKLPLRWSSCKKLQFSMIHSPTISTAFEDASNSRALISPFGPRLAVRASSNVLKQSLLDNSSLSTPIITTTTTAAVTAVEQPTSVTTPTTPKRNRGASRKGKPHSEELVAKITKSIQATYKQEKILKASRLGMTLEEYEEFQLARKYANNKKYRKRITWSPEEQFERRSAVVKRLWEDPIYRAKTTAGRKAYYQCLSMVKVMIAKSLQKLWLKIPYPSSFSKEKRRCLVSKAAKVQLNKTIEVFDEEELQRIKQQKLEESRRKKSERIRQLWATPEFREKASQRRKRTAKFSISNDTMQDIDTMHKPKIIKRSNKTMLNATVDGQPKHISRVARRSDISNATSSSASIRKRSKKLDHNTDMNNSVKPMNAKETVPKPPTKEQIRLQKIQHLIKHYLFPQQDLLTPTKRPDRRSFVAPEEGQEAIKVYEDGRLVGIYTKEEYDNLYSKSADKPS